MERRRLSIVIAVVGFHVLGLWALEAGLLRRAAELVIPVQITAELIYAPQPEVSPQPPSPPSPPTPTPPRPAAVQPPRPAPPAPQPIARAEATPSVNAPTGATAPEPAMAPTSRPAEPAAAPAPAAPPAPQPATPAAPRIELPSSSADYLNNPRPPYPPLSKRLREQGRVVVRVFIDANGSASQADIRTSSGYERLDQTALQTVLRWRYTPGKRNGVPEGMWFNVPINFVLE